MCRQVVGAPALTGCLRARLGLGKLPRARGIRAARVSTRSASHSQKLFITRRASGNRPRKKPSDVLEWQAPAEDLVTASARKNTILVSEFMTKVDFYQL
jgi:hypothetical protein